MQNESIVYVEDEVDYQQIVSRILGKAGYQVSIAESGAEGIQLLEREKPGLLILDVNLPDMDGYALCRRLRRNSELDQMRIFMLTVRQRPEEWLKGFSSGANDYLSKPLNPPEFIERIQACLKAKPMRPILGTAEAELRLIEACRTGNRWAFEMLFRRHRPTLLGTVRRQVTDLSQAEDIVSATFENALEQLGRFKGNSSFETYLLGVALNLLGHERRRPKPANLEIGDENSDGGDMAVEDPALERIENESDYARVRKSFASLPAIYRHILELKVLERMELPNIARHLHIRRKTAWTRLTKGQELLRKAWAAFESEQAEVVR